MTVTGKVNNNAIKTHPPYNGELGYTDKTLIVPRPTYNNEIQKDFKIKANTSFFIFRYLLFVRFISLLSDFDRADT